MDNLNDQYAKLEMMTDGYERELCLDVWRLQGLLDRAEEKMTLHFQGKLQACSSKEEATELMQRIPSIVAKAFFFDYIRYVRDWSMSHEQSKAARATR